MPSTNTNVSEYYFTEVKKEIHSNRQEKVTHSDINNIILCVTSKNHRNQYHKSMY